MTTQAKRGLRAALLGATMLCAVSPASASLINDTFNWQISATGNANFPGSGTLNPTPTDVALFGIGLGWDFSLFVDGNSSTFNFAFTNNNVGFDAGPYGDLMLELTDLDWLPDPGQVTGVQDIGGMGVLTSLQHMFQTTADSVMLSYQVPVGFSNRTTYIEFQILTRHDIPEPSTIVGLLTGLVGVGALRRRKRRKTA